MGHINGLRKRGKENEKRKHGNKDDNNYKIRGYDIECSNRGSFTGRIYIDR